MKSRFSAQESTIKRELMNTMTKIKATSLKIEQDEFTGEVKVIFDRNGTRYTKICKVWGNARDNLRAIGLSIEYMYRAVEIYGVDSQSKEFDNLIKGIFLSMEATPDDTVLKLVYSNNWYEILGVSSNASKLDIQNAFRSLSKVHHPDVGGDKDTFIKIKEAMEKGIKGVESK